MFRSRRLQPVRNNPRRILSQQVVPQIGTSRSARRRRNRRRRLARLENSALALSNKMSQMNFVDSQVRRQLNLVPPTRNRIFNRGSINSTRMGSIRFRNRELVSVVNAGLNTVNVEPGNSGASVLDLLSSSFDNYKLHNFEVEFVSSQSTNTSGQIIAAYDYNGSSPVDQFSIASLMNSISTTIYKNQRFTAIGSRLMKSKFHATFGSISSSTTIPTKAATFCAFVSTDITGQIGQFYISYDITLDNVKKSSSTNSPVNIITSQGVLTPSQPQLVPSVVNSNEFDSPLITAREINAIEPETGSVVNGFGVGVPNQGDKFSLVSSVNTETFSLLRQFNATPTIRVRDSNGNIIPSNVYSIGGEPPTLSNGAKVIHFNKVNDVEDVAVIEWLGAIITFVKAAAPYVIAGAEIVLELVSNLTEFNQAFVASDDATLSESSAVCAKGTEIDVTLPTTVPQDLKDPFNAIIDIYFQVVYTAADSGDAWFQLAVPVSPGLLPSAVALGYRVGTSGDFTTLFLTDNTTKTFHTTSSGLKYALSIKYPRAAVLDAVGYGDVLTVSTVFASATGATGPPFFGAGSASSGLGPFAIAPTFNNYTSVGVIPVISDFDLFNQTFTLDPAWIASATTDLEISFDLSNDILDPGAANNLVGCMSVNLGLLARSDRERSIPMPASTLTRRR